MIFSGFRTPLIAALLFFSVAPALGQSGAPLPRYASLRSSEVNLRAGPGTEYPVEWVFLRRALPIEITAEYGHWRKVRDVDGAEGWVHKSLLSNRRSVLVIGSLRTLRRKPEANAAAVAKAEAGVVAGLLACEDGWCRIDAGGQKGWLPRDQVWGVYEDETVE